MDGGEAVIDHGIPYGPVTDEEFEQYQDCPGCRKRVGVGEHFVLVAIGPGDDPEEQAKARANRYYNAVAVIAHLACATGFTDPVKYSAARIVARDND